MREASRLCAILDDAAARGDASLLRALSDRWLDRRIAAQSRGATTLAVLWKHAALAAGYRAVAIDDRLAGNIRSATAAEGISESHLGILARKATRTP